MVFYTIGHSTRQIDEFIELLKNHKIDLLVDVRTIPKSRYVPQYNSDNLKRCLNKNGIEYAHIKRLGGLRKEKKDSINLAWKNKSFMGFADYMQTTGFESGINELMDISKKKKVCIMCAEAVPWRCHRSLIADALIIRGLEVVHIIGKNNEKKHILTSFAKIIGKKLTYPK